MPLELVSDNGPEFRSTQLAEYLGWMGVRQVFSSPYSPQSCGMVERLNRIVKEAIQPESSRMAAEDPAKGRLNVTSEDIAVWIDASALVLSVVADVDGEAVEYGGRLRPEDGLT